MNSQRSDKLNKLQALKNKFAEGLPVRLEEMTQTWNTIKSQVLDESTIADFLRHVHSLSGTAATMGYPELGTSARQLEKLIRERIGEAESDPQQTVDLISTKLESVIAASHLQLTNQEEETGDNTTLSGENTDSYNTSANQYGLVYLLEQDQALVTEIESHLAQLEYAVASFNNPRDLQTAMSVRVPDVLVTTDHLIGEDSLIYSTIDQIVEDRKLPVIVISQTDSWDNRLSALRAGARAFLAKPLNFDELIEHLDILCDVKSTTDYHILIVDDEPLLAEHYAAVLESAGMVTKVITDPSVLLKWLREFSPDLILMDLYMGSCNGIEAASLVRQHSAYINLPIVYLSTESGLQQQMKALQVGGDDFLEKPISDDYLINAIKVRARRFHQLNELMDRDSLTGLLNHVNLKLSLEKEISRAERDHSTLCFVMLDIDHFKAINDNYGHPTGDRVIKILSRLLSHQLRKTDIVARYGGEEFAVILPICGPDEALKIINKIREGFSVIKFHQKDKEFSVTFSAGIVSYSLAETGKKADIEMILEGADQALYASKSVGRNRVTVADSDT